MNQDVYDFVVGIGFGTTYSECCFVNVNDDNQSIEIVKDWPGQTAVFTTVPTTITYSKKNRQPIGIGYIPETPLTYLHKELPDLLVINNSVNQPKPTDSVADFLKIFNDHVIKKIKQSANNPNLKPRIRYCFTLQHPSEPSYLKNLIASIERAGIYDSKNDRDDKLVFIDSYTAMAKYFLRTRDGLTSKDKFIVCDTDDYYLTIKTIEVISNGRNKDVKELKHHLTDTELGGNSLDSYFRDYISVIARENDDYKEMDPVDFDHIIDNMIQNFIKNIKYKDFGKKPEIYIAKPASPFTKSKDPYLTLKTDDLKKNVYDKNIDMVQNFIKKIKRKLYKDFGKKPEIYIAKPASPFTKSKDPYLTLKTDDLKKHVYDKIIDRICEHVLSVCHEQQPKAFFLFGKFSNSDYLYDKLKKIVDEIIVIPEKDVSAAQGAVYHGLNEPLSIQRMAPIHDGDNQLQKIEDPSYYDFNYSDYSHVIGIDFGTSISKWYYQSTDPTSKPVEFNKELMLFPSFSLYDRRLHDQKLWGTEAYKNYYSPENSGKLLARFKMLLYEIESENFDELTAIKYIANYLQELHQKILETMKGFIAGPSKFRYCLTVPTIWSDKTKKYMRDAAVLAKIINDYDHPCRLMLVNEPEAAAMFYTQDPYFVEKFPSKDKIRALVCDAGGGTVGMATYEFSKEIVGYSIHEVTPGSGGICGASLLDDNFRKLITKKCYDMNYNISYYVLDQMVNHFAITLKELFTGIYDDDIVIVVPEKALPIEIELTVTANELTAEVFEPVTTSVLDLIKGQYRITREDNAELDVIILTGGLGQSRYLQHRIQTYFRNIRVYYPFKCDQSVVQGAVSLALNPNMITQRITRKSYGVEVLLPFDPTRDSAMYKYKTIKGKEYIKFKYDSFATINSSIPTYMCYEKEYFVEYPNNTYAAVYASEFSENQEIRNIRDSKAEEVFKFNIEMPKNSTRKVGDMVPLKIRMFLGQTEIKVDTVFEGEVTRQSFKFNATSPQHRIETEAIHKKSAPQISALKIAKATKRERPGSLSVLLSRLAQNNSKRP